MGGCSSTPKNDVSQIQPNGLSAQSMNPTTSSPAATTSAVNGNHDSSANNQKNNNNSAANIGTASIPAEVLPVIVPTTPPRNTSSLPSDKLLGTSTNKISNISTPSSHKSHLSDTSLDGDISGDASTRSMHSEYSGQSSMDTSNHSSCGPGGGNNGGGGSVMNGGGGSTCGSTCGSSARKRKSKIDRADSKVGLNEIISDLKNHNLVRIEVPLGKPIEEVYEGVHDGPVLGSGISGIVRLVKHRTTQVSYAVKCLDLALIDSGEGLKQLKEEIYIMCQLDHPNIVRLEEVYESHSEIYLVQEVCKGGELFDRLDEQPDYHYTEAQCARLVKQMLSSVRYIHNKGIIHRDLKLENFLFSELDAESELKMIDFGLSKHFTFGEVHHEAVGTPYTVAPEVIRGSYDERCDVWAIGVITYLLLSGEPPFGGCGGPETLMQVRDNILRGAFRFEPEDIWQTVSQEAKDFIRSLLVIDPLVRPTAQQAQESEWLKVWADRANVVEDAVINPNVVKALVNFKEYSDMRKLLCEVLSFTLLPEQIQDLRKEFEKYDQEGTGEITLTTLKKVLIGNASTGSLGGLTEEEVEDIFNAMRVRKGETTIHWHDFIAAGLSQCKVDDRNLRLAFERLDADHKGYITFDNVMDLMGNETFEKEDVMLQMWGESMKDVDCKTALITYEDFVLLMKGQKREKRDSSLVNRFSKLRSSGSGGLDAVPEVVSPREDGIQAKAQPEVKTTPLVAPLDIPPPPDMPTLLLPKTPKLSPKEPLDLDSEGTPPINKNMLRQGSSSAPPTPLHYGKRFDDIEQVDSPLSMDEDEGGKVSFNNTCLVFPVPNLDLTPPQSPVRGPADYVTPTAARATFNPQLLSKLAPPDLSAIEPPPSTTRSRSVSMDDKDTHDPTTEKRTMLFKRDSRRALAIPEHTHALSDIDRVLGDETKTPLVVNRKLYRAHREFRHAVTDACKRFEDEQMRRAKETLRAQERNKHTAGLVMRHGQALSEASIKNFLKKTMEEQQTLVDQANRRGGRGKRSRKKTISDMSGMLGPASPADQNRRVTSATPTIQEETSPPPSKPSGDNKNLRNPTKPGEFRKTNYDPFKRETIFENGKNNSNNNNNNSSSSTRTSVPSIPNTSIPMIPFPMEGRYTH